MAGALRRNPDPVTAREAARGRRDGRRTGHKVITLEERQVLVLDLVQVLARIPLPATLALPKAFAEPSKARGGRHRIPDRAVLSGIVFALGSGIPWRMPPKETGFGSGVTKSWPGRRHSGRRHERVADALFHSSLLGIRSTKVEPRPSSLSTAISHHGLRRPDGLWPIRGPRPGWSAQRLLRRGAPPRQDPSGAAHPLGRKDARLHLWAITERSTWPAVASPRFSAGMDEITQQPS